MGTRHFMQRRTSSSGEMLRLNVRLWQRTPWNSASVTKLIIWLIGIHDWSLVYLIEWTAIH